MPDFKIYKSEAGVRMENAQLKRDLELARADNARLRALVGEEAIAVSVAPVARAQGEAFASGNCTVSIGPAAGPAKVNPVAAGTRAPRPIAPVRSPATIAIAEQPQMQQVGRQKDVDSDDGVLRFSMIELNGPQ